MASFEDQPEGADHEAVPDLDQVRGWVNALLDGRLRDGDRKALERSVIRHSAAAQEYLRLIHLHGVIQLHAGIGILGSTPEDLRATILTDEPLAIPGLGDTMILPAVRLSPADDAAAHPATGTLAFDETGPFRSPRSTTRRWALAAAAVLAVGATLFWSAWRTRVPYVATTAPPGVVVAGAPAIVTATAAAFSTDGAPLFPNSPVAAGQSLHLATGALELQFENGTVAVVQAPADVRVIDTTACVVVAGSAAFHVPTNAIGFRVQTPGMLVVDRGTDFGVLVKSAEQGTETADETAPDSASASGWTDVHVLKGRVDASVSGADGQVVPASVQRVSAGAAVRHVHAADALAPTPIAFDPTLFSLDIAKVRVPVLASHGTGAGLSGGATDPNWQVTPPPEVGPTQAAIVLTKLVSEYTANTPEAQWISTVGDPVNIPGGDFTYRTTVDLAGFDPATVVGTAWVAADDRVRTVRVNGTAASTSAEADAQPPWKGRHAYNLKGPWHAGANQLEVVVYNVPGLGTPGRSPNFSAVQVKLDIAATPHVQR